MTDYKGIKIVFGAAGPAFTSDDTGPKILQVLKEEGVKDLDTARGYGDSEEKLGQNGAVKDFIISTKYSGSWSKKPANKENITASIEESFKLLKTDKVDVYYLHCPDRETPVEQILEAINDQYKQGRFERFGLSNFLPDEVEEYVRVAKEKGFVVPSVYQGNYSAVSRKPETILFPVLRKHNIAFYAYSPIAGGFLTKTRKQLEDTTHMRWDPKNTIGQIYTTLYSKPSFLDALSKWEAISEASGIPKAELAYRWVAYHSPLDRAKGDALICGASSIEQAQKTIQGLRNGPLEEKYVKQVDEVWDTIKDDAGLDNFNLNNA